MYPSCEKGFQQCGCSQNQKPIILNDKNKINENKKYIYETVDDAKQNGDNNFIRTKDIYNFNNQKINSNNQRNFDNKNNEINNTKSMNSSVGDQKNQKEMNKDNNNNTNNKQKDKNSEINSQYQTYSGSFRNTNKIIRVNMIFKGLDKPIKVEKQELETKERRGFTVVEWGATEIK